MEEPHNLEIEIKPRESLPLKCTLNKEVKAENNLDNQVAQLEVPESPKRKLQPITENPNPQTLP
jgi:hypothetical protein